MIHRVFSVYDSKAEAFLLPIHLPTVGMALRAVGDCVNDPSHQFGQHPEDYALFSLGQYDDANARYELLDAPAVLSNLIELVKSDV